MYRTVVLSALALSPNVVAQNWKLQYFYDHERERLEFADLAFPTATRGIAVGVIRTEGEPPKPPRPVVLTTADGGTTWVISSLKEFPKSLHFLNEATGWIVADEGIWFTHDSGQNWEKTSGQRNNRLLKVWFL